MTMKVLVFRFTISRSACLVNCLVCELIRNSGDPIADVPLAIASPETLNDKHLNSYKT